MLTIVESLVIARQVTFTDLLGERRPLSSLLDNIAKAPEFSQLCKVFIVLGGRSLFRAAEQEKLGYSPQHLLVGVGKKLKLVLDFINFAFKQINQTNVHVYRLYSKVCTGTPRHRMLCPAFGIDLPATNSILVQELRLRTILLPKEEVIVICSESMLETLP